MNRNGQLILNAQAQQGCWFRHFRRRESGRSRATELGVCLTSEKPRGTLDVVRCQETSCPNPGRQAYAGAIFNAENSTAKYVGHFAVWFVELRKPALFPATESRACLTHWQRRSYAPARLGGVWSDVRRRRDPERWRRSCADIR